MKFDDLIKELGAFTVLNKLSTVKNLNSIKQEIVKVLPDVISVEMIEINLTEALNEVPRLHRKDQLIIAGPELIILELLCSLKFNRKVIVAIDSCLNSDMVSRISSNVPEELDVQVIQIPEIPFNIKPANSVIVAVGFKGGHGYTLVPETTNNILSFYQIPYLGDVVLLDPLGYNIFVRPRGWVLVNESKYFTRSVSVKIQKEA